MASFRRLDFKITFCTVKVLRKRKPKNIDYCPNIINSFRNTDFGDNF